jgi:DNA recombination protein RmuC
VQFGDVLAKTKKKLIEATNVIDTSEVRTRAIERKLRNVQELPAAEILDKIDFGCKLFNRYQSSGR